MKRNTVEAKYICPDHPNVKSNQAEKCGKCGGKMEKIEKSNSKNLLKGPDFEMNPAF